MKMWYIHWTDPLHVVECISTCGNSTQEEVKNNGWVSEGCNNKLQHECPKTAIGWATFMNKNGILPTTSGKYLEFDILITVAINVVHIVSLLLITAFQSQKQNTKITEWTQHLTTTNFLQKSCLEREDFLEFQVFVYF